MSKCYTADFETTTDPNDIRVWAYGICEIGNPTNFIYGNNIGDFINFCKKENNFDLYFHNLKFDGEFIISYLLNNGYEVIKDKKDKKDKTFSTLISDTGQFYNITIYFKVTKSKTNKVTIYDSMKILNFGVDKIAKDFKLPISKLKIDYDKKREIGYQLTKEEVDYLRNDVEIMSRALNFMFEQDLKKMTIGSDALYNYKQINKNFDKYYPILHYEIDQDIRKSYKGGFTYLNPLYKEKETNAGVALDVNSLYPSVMVKELLPFGDPIYFKGEYKKDILYNLYIQNISCSFELKKGFIPSIQIKNSLAFIPNEYIESSDNEIVNLTLTNIDLELFKKHYDIYDITYHSGFKFKSVRGLFTEYIDCWSNKKIEAKKNGNAVLYTISKLMLNSLYGKFGLNPNVRGKYPYLVDGVVKYGLYEKEIRDSIYVSVASFITSYARKKTIETSQIIRDYSIKKYGVDKYVYSDTDSIHCLFESIINENGEIEFVNDKELYDLIEIDEYNMGAWKIESRFKKGKYIRQKCYIEQEYDDKINVTIAGLPKKTGSIINFSNFEIGFTTEKIDKKIMKGIEKLSFKHLKGGVLLVPTDFSIK